MSVQEKPLNLHVEVDPRVEAARPFVNAWHQKRKYKVRFITPNEKQKFDNDKGYYVNDLGYLHEKNGKLLLKEVHGARGFFKAAREGRMLCVHLYTTPEHLGFYAQGWHDVTKLEIIENKEKGKIYGDF